jgi:uncharacterized repeat protein (TIGR01451 family)
MFKAVFQKISGPLIACAIIASAIGAIVPNMVAHADYAHGDCDTNAVIRCGVADSGELKDDYRANQGGNVHAIYEAFSISGEASFDGMVNGRVTKSGDVYAGDQKVATGAVTAGRVNMAGSTPILDGQAFMRTPSVSFLSDSLDALVKLDGQGSFSFAVIMACGNPVNAYPVPKPPVKPPVTPPKTPETPKKPGFEIAKDVRVKGQTAWQPEIVEAKPGDELEYRVTVKNTGQTDLTNVILKDVLPANSVTFADDGPLTGVEGTIKQLTSATGVNLGTIAKGQSKEVTFSVTLGKDVDACKTALRNVASAKPDTQTEKSNDARAKVCQPQVLAAVTPTGKGGPETLVETGPGALVGIFASVSIAGAVAHRLLWTRRFKLLQAVRTVL